MLGTILPLRATTMSPKRMPARSAGPPDTALRSKAPSALGRPSESASGSSSGSMSTPSQPFCGSLAWLPSLACSLISRCGCVGSVGRDGVAGVCCASGAACALLPIGERCGIRTMLRPESEVLSRCGRGMLPLSSRAHGTAACAAWAQAEDAVQTPIRARTASTAHAAACAPPHQAYQSMSKAPKGLRTLSRSLLMWRPPAAPS